MRLGVVFWCYRDPVVCRNRLRVLRRRNPGLALYVLYGGPPAAAAAFEAALGPYADDFYVHEGDEDAEWRWRNGDLMLARWHDRRGRHLAWDSVFVVQWDMVLTAPVGDILQPLEPGDMLLSGLRPLSEVAPWWHWLKDGRDAEYDAFFARLAREHPEHADDVRWCCQFVGVVFPRPFLEAYAAVPDPELGFLEYKIPAYAQVFGVRLVPDETFRPWWAEEPVDVPAPRWQRQLHAGMWELRLPLVLAEARRPGGRRLFHPYRHVYPFDLRSAGEWLAARRDLRSGRPGA